ncbi:MAG: hypothetical protein PHY54_09610 [Methylococcales bacterium]|nr:hypothetical protein [Methylococcales bacterium]
MPFLEIELADDHVHSHPESPYGSGDKQHVAELVFRQFGGKQCSHFAWLFSEAAPSCIM